MGQYKGKVEWRDSIYIVDSHTKILGGDPEWSNDQGVDGFANISAAQLTDRTNYLRAEVNAISYRVDSALESFMQGDNNLSELTDPAQARYRLGLGLVDNTRDRNKPISDYQRVEFNKKVDKSTKVMAGDGLEGGGSLSSDISIELSQSSNEALEMAVNALQVDLNLSDISDKGVARDNLELGSAAIKDVGEEMGDVLGVGGFGIGGNLVQGIGESSPLSPTGFGYDSESGFFINARYLNSVAGFRLSNTPYSDNFYLEYSDIDNKEVFKDKLLVHHSGNFNPTTKQDKLEAGDNITIVDNKISTVSTSYQDMAVSEMLSGESEEARTMTAKNINDYSGFTNLQGEDITIDFNEGRNFLSQLEGNITIQTPSGMKSGITGDVVLFSEVGDKTLTFSPVWKFPEGEAPSVKGDSRTIISYKVVDANTIVCGFMENVK